MTNPTSNYSFQMPTATDLVTDLPADFEVFGQAVDTRLKALQPGTTLGDLAYSSATANTNTRLGIGTSGQVLAVSGGGVPAWTTPAAGGGKLLQVVQGVSTTSTTNTTTTYADTSLTATITPTLNTSKILVIVSQMITAQGTGDFVGIGHKTLRDATVIIDDTFGTGTAHFIEAEQSSGNSRIGLRTYLAVNLLDSPATTSATTYKTQFAPYTASDVAVCQQNGNQSSITLMEIGA